MFVRSIKLADTNCEIVMTCTLFELQVGLMKEKYDHRLLLKHLPSDFRQFLEHLQSLEYADKPDYAMLLGLFERTMKRRGVRETDPFDWEKTCQDTTAGGSTTLAARNPTAPAIGGTPAALSGGGGGGGAVVATTTADNNHEAVPVDNQENMEPDNHLKGLRISELDPKRRHRSTTSATMGVGAQGGGDANTGGGADLAQQAGGGGGTLPRVKEMDKNCNNPKLFNLRRTSAEGGSGNEEKGAEDGQRQEKDQAGKTAVASGSSPANVDQEGDAVMRTVWNEGGGERGSEVRGERASSSGGGVNLGVGESKRGNANRDSGIFALDVLTRTEGDQEPPSPSPRMGGRDIWCSEAIQDSSQPLSFNVKGTLERRQRRLHLASKSSSFKYRCSVGSGGAGTGDNSVTQMAMMDDDNVSAAYTHGGGGGLTLHSRWKSQFDDSEGEGSERDETEMKGENLQSPEHRGEEQQQQQQQPPLTSAAKATTPLSNLAKPPSSSKLSPSINANNLSSSAGKNELISSPAASPHQHKGILAAAAAAGNSSITAAVAAAAACSSDTSSPHPVRPVVVIPPPPQLAPPPPPPALLAVHQQSEFPLQHSASAPSIPRGSPAAAAAAAAAATKAAAGNETRAAGAAAAAVDSTAAVHNSGASTAPVKQSPPGFTPPPPPQFAPPPPPATAALGNTASLTAAATTTSVKSMGSGSTNAAGFVFSRHPLQHSTSVSSGISGQNHRVPSAAEMYLTRPTGHNLPKSPLLQEIKLPSPATEDGDDNEEEEGEEEEDDDDEEGDEEDGQPPEYVAAVCQYTTILKDAPPGFSNEEYEVNYLNLEKGVGPDGRDKNIPRTWSNPQICDSDDGGGGRGGESGNSSGSKKRKEQRRQQQQHQQQIREHRSGDGKVTIGTSSSSPLSNTSRMKITTSGSGRIPSSYSSDFKLARSNGKGRDIEYIEIEDEEEEEEDQKGGVTGRFAIQIGPSSAKNRGKFFQTEVDDDEEDGGGDGEDNQDEDDEEEEEGEEEEEEDDDEEEGEEDGEEDEEESDNPPIPPPRSKSKESSLVNVAAGDVKSPSRSPNDRSVYYDAVAEPQQGGGHRGHGGGGGQQRSLGSFRENVEKKNRVSGESSESCNSRSGGSDWTQSQRARHQRRRERKEEQQLQHAGGGPGASSGSQQQQYVGSTKQARRISLDDLSSAFQALVNKKSSSSKSKSASSGAKKNSVGLAGAAVESSYQSDNSGIDDKSSDNRFRSRSEESLLDADDKLGSDRGSVGPPGAGAGGGGGVMLNSQGNSECSQKQQRSGCSPRPPSRTSVSRIPLPLRSGNSPTTSSYGSSHHHKEDSLERYSDGGGGGGVGSHGHPPSYEAYTSGLRNSGGDHSSGGNNVQIPAASSSTSYLIGRYGSAEPNRYSSYTIYNTPSSSAALSHHNQSEHPYSNSRYATAGAKAEYFRNAQYPSSHYSMGGGGQDHHHSHLHHHQQQQQDQQQQQQQQHLQQQQADPPVSPRWRRRSYDYEQMMMSSDGGGAATRPPMPRGPGIRSSPSSHSQSGTTATDYGGSAVAGVARSRSRTRMSMSEYEPYNRYSNTSSSSLGGGAGSAGVLQASTRPVSNYMYGHSYTGYHLPGTDGSPTALSSGGQVVAPSSAEMLQQQLHHHHHHQQQQQQQQQQQHVQPQQPHPHPPLGSYSRGGGADQSREVGARIRRYQPT